MKDSIRIKITRIHEEDACYGESKYIGLIGVFKNRGPNFVSGYYSGDFYPDDKDALYTGHMYFYAIRYKRV